MALKQSLLNKIPTTIKDLVFGYVQQIESKGKTSIPTMLKYLCLIYFNPNDYFYPNKCGSNISIRGDTIRTIFQPQDDKSIRNVYLSNIIRNGVHVWKFVCHSDYNKHDLEPDMIGIFQISENGFDNKPHLLGEYFDNDVFGECTGYGFTSTGKLSNPSDPMKWGEIYGKKWKKGDIIEMSLDMDKWTLSYKINDKKYPLAFIINGCCEYCAAISFGYKPNVKPQIIKLLSYQRF